MKYVKEFGIILIVSLVGELLNYFLPLPVPASIYGLALMFLCLMLGIIKLSDVHDTACFLIEIMPIMFIPPAVGLMASWDVIQANLVAYLVIATVTTIVVMAVSGLVTQAVLKKGKKGRRRNDILNSPSFSASLSVLLPTASACCKSSSSLFNPLLISVVLTIAVLLTAHISYDTFYEGAKYLSYLLTPATVCLAVPLYEKLSPEEQLEGPLRRYSLGVITTLCSVFVMSGLFHLTHEEYVTLLPKSITTAIGMGISEELGGYVTLTVAMIIITGIFGNVIAVSVCRLFRITDPIAKGVSIGSAAHALGTAKALEIGEVEGAMSSLSIVVAGLLTVVGASIFANLM